MSVRSNLSTRIEYDLRAGRYRDIRSGQFVSQQTVRRELDTVLDKAARQAREATQQLQQRRITVAQWERQMAESIRRTHTASAALAKGGWANLSQSDYGKIGATCKEQYRYLDRFAAQIESGAIPLDGRILTRAESYVNHARITYAEDRLTIERQLGATEVRSIRHSADSCAGCIEMAALGWVSIAGGTMILPGDRQCKSHCKCVLSTR